MLQRSRLAVTVACATLVVALLAQDARREVTDFLAKAGFTAAEVGQMDAGQVIAHSDPGSTNGELLTSAAVKILVPRENVLAYYAQMVTYVDGKVTLAYSKFSSPPTQADVKALAFDASEISELRTCKPADCDLHIGGAGLDTLRSAINWKAPDAAEQVNAFARKQAVAYVTAYQAQGDAALVTYTNTSKPVSMKETWQGLIGNSPLFHQYLPELAKYLTGFPNAKLPGGRDVFYWVKENYGRKPVISIVHAVIYEPPSQKDRVIVVQKQLYASHYYDGSFAIADVIQGNENGKPVSYLLYGNRSRGDLLKGGFGGLQGNVAKSQTRKAAIDTLTTIKTMLESAR
jgi:hypothetical protein